MALGRRVIGPRRVVVAMEVELATGGTIVVADPAVDLGKTDLAAYRESLWELDRAVMKPGEQPTIFTIKPLTRRQKDAAEGFAARQRAAWYLRCGVVGIENYQIVKADRVVEADQPEPKPNGAMGEMASEAWVDSLDLPEEHLLALMYMIRHISEAQLPTSAASGKPSGAAASGGTTTAPA